MREICTSGSVGGRPGNRLAYPTNRYPLVKKGDPPALLGRQ